MRFLTLLTFVGYVSTFKYVIFVPNMANSQTQFCARVAEVLANGGHDVIMLFVNHLTDFKTDVKVPESVKTYHLNEYVPGVSSKTFEIDQSENVFKITGTLDMPSLLAMSARFEKMFQDGCRMILRNKEFLRWLESEKFDVAFAYVYSSCPLGLIHNSKIPSWIWLNSGPIKDHVAHTVGMPIIPSYVPPVVMESHDEMGFFFRVKSFIGHSLIATFRRSMHSTVETEIFREELNDPNFPNTMDLGASCPLIMVNSNELYDLARPTLHKIINIGGLGVGFETAQPLTEEFKKLTFAGKGLIVFSFGSIAPAHKMPLEWKNAFLEAFESFPDYQFVLRYLADDLNERLPKNVYLSKWLPQKDLLLHNNTKAFITHGGYNSMQEAISARVPLITIPLFSDQHKNAQIASKHGISVNIRKVEISKERIVDALKEVLENDKYKRKVSRLNAMVRNQPMKPEERLLKWAEFLAEFKTLENLTPAGLKLNFLQYHSLDVIGFILTVAFVVFYVFFIVLRKFCRFKTAQEKLKNE